MKTQFRTFELSDPRFETDGIRMVTLKSKMLGQRCDISIHTPDGASHTPNMPIVILLHGVYGSHWAWTLKGGAHKTNQRLHSQGAIPPMTLVMPSDGLWGDGSGYLAHRSQDFERWIVEEVPAAARYAVEGCSENSPVFIAGLSMGGFGALRIAAKYPERFAAASGHSSVTHFDQMREFVEEHPSSFTALEEDRSVLDQMLRHSRRLCPFRFDCGTEDHLIEANRALHDSLNAHQIPHVYREFPGGHEWDYWESHLEDSLRFFAEHTNQGKCHH
jgi:S-formylglutathione hydrolase FrmB